jgi:hypothetical protein
VRALRAGLCRARAARRALSCARCAQSSLIDQALRSSGCNSVHINST